MNAAARAEALFLDAFGVAATACASAPGRVNIIGEHVDYHGGHVLPCAISERTAVAVGPARGLNAVSEQGVSAAGPWTRTPRRDWTDYVVGAALELGDGRSADGLALAVASDVPLGAGLSSSAALSVAATIALSRWYGREVRADEVALNAWRAETGFAGMPCGRMDQIAVTHSREGCALLLDCRTLKTEPVHVGADLVVAFSGERHELVHSGYADRRREGEEALRLLRDRNPAIENLVDLPPARLAEAVSRLPAPLDRRVRHVVNENQRTLLAVQALARDDFAALGVLINASHASLQQLYECSTARIDALVARARELPRVLGARLMGGGWGGSVLVATEPGAGGMVADLLRPHAPGVWFVRPGPGAVGS